MATQLAQGAARPVPVFVPVFDPAVWLSALVSIGGGYALASGRKLWLVVDSCDPSDLASVMRPLIGEPDRVEAVRTAIEHRSFGELQA